VKINVKILLVVTRVNWKKMWSVSSVRRSVSIMAATYAGGNVDKQRDIKLEMHFEEERLIEIELEMKKGERLWGRGT